MPVLVEIVVTTYVLKAIVAAADTPLVYLASRWKHAGVIPPIDADDDVGGAQDGGRR